MADIIYGATGINIAAHGNVGAMTSELLDEYEEGTFTPAGNNVTYSSTVGAYTKVARIVQCVWAYVCPSNSDGNAHNTSGFPFANAIADGCFGQGYATHERNNAKFFIQGQIVYAYTNGGAAIANSVFSGAAVRLGGTHIST